MIKFYSPHSENKYTLKMQYTTSEGEQNSQLMHEYLQYQNVYFLNKGTVAKYIYAKNTLYDRSSAF